MSHIQATNLPAGEVINPDNNVREISRELEGNPRIRVERIGIVLQQLRLLWCGREACFQVRTSNLIWRDEMSFGVTEWSAGGIDELCDNRISGSDNGLFAHVHKSGSELPGRRDRDDATFAGA